VTLALDIRSITKRYSGHVAVRDLSLQVPKGTVYGLLGPNGAGKTTTIRMLLNIIAPDEGSISILGRLNTERGVLDQVGYLPEERGLYRKMQVRRLLRFLAELKGVKGAEANRRIDAWLDRLSLRTAEKDWGAAKVDELSRGMQQKVQFIGTLLHEPQLVILDEPFSGLDPINSQALGTRSSSCGAPGARCSSARTSWTTPSGCATPSASSRGVRRCSTARSRR
jgi:ABC-2 type transport system ATP-binding protein